MNKKNNSEEYDGAIAVMENYLDGAVADYENGMVDNEDLINSCIKAIKTLQSPILNVVPNEYEERMKKAKEVRKQSEQAEVIKTESQLDT